VIQQLPTGSAVLADAATADALRQAGRAQVRQSLGNWRHYHYIVISSRWRSAAHHNRTVSSVLSATKPMAIFGNGRDRVEVAVVLGGSGDAARLAQVEMKDRRVADAELLRNPRVHVSARSRAVFATGRLDLRAAALLALTAGAGDVTVQAVPTQPAEDAAGLPARRLVLSLRSFGNLRNALASLPASYRPAAVERTGRRIRLAWPVRIPPVRVLH
jgi:hypothetical protein